MQGPFLDQWNDRLCHHFQLIEHGPLFSALARLYHINWVRYSFTPRGGMQHSIFFLLHRSIILFKQQPHLSPT